MQQHGLSSSHWLQCSRSVAAAAAAADDVGLCDIDDDNAGAATVDRVIYARRRRRHFVAVSSLTASPSPAQNTTEPYRG